jgi:hypothetical protein
LKPALVKMGAYEAGGASSATGYLPMHEGGPVFLLEEREGGEMMKRRVAAALFASLLALSAMAPAALADPDCTGPNKPGACGGGGPHHGPK